MAEQHETERRLLLRVAGKVDPSARKAIEEQAKFMEELGTGMLGVAEAQKLVTEEMFKFAGKHFPDVWKEYVEEMKRTAMAEEELAKSTKEATAAETTQGAAVTQNVSILKRLFDAIGGATGAIKVFGAGLVTAGGIQVWKKMQEGWKSFKSLVVAGTNEILDTFKQWTAYIIDINADMQQTVVSFEALLGSQERAAAFMAKVRDMAVAAGVSYTEMAASAKQLVPYARGDPEEFERMLKLMSLLRAYKPEAGIAGAQLAISQAMAGQYYTLARRFAINPSVIRQLEDAGLRGLDLMEAVLEKMGIGEGLLEAQANTWKSLLASIKDFAVTALTYVTKPAFDLFHKQLQEGVTWMRANVGQIDALAMALGEDLGGAVKEITSVFFGPEGFNEDAIFKVADWGARIVAALVEGLLWGANNVLIPAIVQITEIIASFLKGSSPPKMGILHTIDKWFGPVLRAYLSGFSAEDFQMLSEIGRIIQVSLATAVAGGDITKGDMTSRLLESRALIVKMVQELRTGGAIAASSWAELGNIIGMDVQLIQGYIELVNRLKAAQAALTAAQNAYAAAMKVVRAIQEEIRLFELETAEIPERYKRGRRMELEFKLMAAQEEARIRQEQVQAAQAQVKEAQELLNAYKATITQLGELADAALKASEEEEDMFGITDAAFDATGGLIEQLKGKWLDLYKSIHKAFEPVKDDFKFLVDFFKGLLGKPVGQTPGGPLLGGREAEYGLPGEEVTPGYDYGVRLKEAFEGIAANASKIGEVITKITSGIKDFVDWYNNDAPEWLKKVLAVGAMAIAINWATGGLVGSLGLILAGAGLVAASGPIAAIAAWALPIGLTIAGVAGLSEALAAAARAAGFDIMGPMEFAKKVSFIVRFKMGEGEGQSFSEAVWSLFEDVHEELKKRFPWVAWLVEGVEEIGEGMAESPWLIDEMVRFKELIENLKTTPIKEWFFAPDEAETAAGDVVTGVSGVFAGASDAITKAVEEGVVVPMLSVFEEGQERTVGHSIFPDMMDAIVKLFQELPARLMAPLQQVLLVIDTYGQATATIWNYYITSMRNDIQLFIDDLYRAMAALAQYAGAAAVGAPGKTGKTGVKGYQMGGMVDRLEYALVHPGEIILNASQQRGVAMAIAEPPAGYGSGAITVSVDQSGWHVGIDGLPTLGEVRRIVKDGVFSGITEVFQGAGA